MPNEKLYNGLAWIWPIMSPPEDYVDEALFFVKLASKYAPSGGRKALNLGCGGGHVDYTLKKYFNITGVDKSESMLELARKLNPDADYIQGDMRDIRLDKLFDTVIVHDSISYMLSERDLKSVFETAFLHLKPGGLFMAIVEETPDKFRQNKVNYITHSRNGVEITSVEHFYDPDPKDNIYDYVLIYMIKQDRQLRVEVDNHTCGIFPLSTWENLLDEEGFENHHEEYFQSADYPNESYTVLVAFKPMAAI
jgi:SAM-dependent methyltransferase